jgi:polyhydroxybutyrate depolymerase
VFAAIGVVSGGFIGERATAVDYMPKKPVSLLTIIGTQDRYFEQFNAGLDTWRQRLRCTPNSAGPPPATTVNHSRVRCADGSDIDTYVVTGMGHVWPGAKVGRLAGADVSISATDLIWAFFAAHTRAKR